MKRFGSLLLLVTASAAMLTSAQSEILYDNSNITTGVGNGLNGANTSSIASNGSSSGYSDNGVTLRYSLAEDFTLLDLASVSLITFDAYSTSTYPSSPVSPFTGATVKIWNAQPGTAGAAVLFTSSTLATTSWTGVYRVSSTTLTDAQRPVFSLGVSFTGATLSAGTYWASWTVTGITQPGNNSFIFGPPLMNTDGTMPAGNGLQSSIDGTTWSPAVDLITGVTNRFPLTVSGAVPEPTTVAATVLAGFATMAVARHRKARA